MSDSELTVANRGIWIPNTVWESKELSIQEKALLAKIHGFEECFASNQYLADFIGLSVTRVKALIKSLTDKGFITRTEERQGQLTVKRTLTVVAAKYYGVEGHEPENGPTQARKQAHPQPENGHHNNTELVIQNNNTDFPPTGVTAPEGADSVCPVCNGEKRLLVETQANGMTSTSFRDCNHCNGTGKEPTCNDGLQVVNSELTSEQPPKADKRARAVHSIPAGQAEPRFDMPVENMKLPNPMMPCVPPKADKPLNVPFDDFWNLYNKKVDRKKAEAKWKRLSNKDREAAIAALPAYIRNTPEVQYRKNPVTYLNNESWNDEIPQTGRNMSYPAQSVPRNNSHDTPIVPKTIQRQAMSDEEIARQRAELANVLKGV